MPSARDQHRSGRARQLAAVAAAVAAAAFLNTLPAQFTFDDSFAVLYNGDVTDHNKPLRALLQNDFWGQDLRSSMSHKSYRPLTVLSFRVQHLVSTRLFPAGAPTAQRGEWEDDGRRRGDRGLNPLPFHVCNVAAHAGATALVFFLARQLVTARRRPAATPTGAGLAGAGAGSDPAVAAAAAGFQGSLGADVEAFVAALLFGLHPVHCEAVAGIVGHAELLCAVLSMLGLLSYMAAADGRRGAGGGPYWRAVGAAVLLGLAAALAKEIGITIMGTMLCYDLLVVPLEASGKLPQSAGASVPAQPQQAQQKPAGQQQAGADGKQPGPRQPAGGIRASSKAASPAPAAVAAAATELLLQAAAGKGAGGRAGSAAAERRRQASWRKQALRRKLLRMALVAAAVVLYIKVRSWLAGDQLVRIYRKVENPIPFSPSSLERKLTTGYLHARYAWLLLMPLQLSADWSYACIEYVSSLSDPRNLATAALYLFLLYTGLAARPWEVLLQWAGRQADPAPAQHERRWRLAVTAGLVVGPFFPASNVLFYVGTFIGERLLYFPSVGYCLLLAQPLAAALHPLVQQITHSSTSGASEQSSGDGEGGNMPRAPPTRARQARAVAAPALLLLLLLFYAVRTVLRNEDWRDEERLFLSAQKVCWRSGKVQLNSGIVERRHQRWEQAEAHFRLAKAVDPGGFCEPDYHIGITLLSKNLTAAVEYLELGVRCKYTAADSVKALNRIYMSLVESSPAHASGVMERWGAVLALPQLQRYTEAATYYENAAARAPSHLAAVMVLNRAQTLLAEARPVAVGRTPDFPVRVPASAEQLKLLRRCMAGRRPVAMAVLGAGGSLTAREVKQAAYNYLTEYGDECRGPVPLPDEPEPQDRAPRTTSYHAGLMHSLQEADANDPWLQQEWGLMLVAAGRHQEALMHLEVAGHIFASQLAPPPAPGSTSPLPAKVLDAEGAGPISKEEAAEAAVAAYRHAQAAVEGMQAAPGTQIDPVAKQRVLCHLAQAECTVLQQRAALAGAGTRAAAAAAADEARCRQAAEARGCASGAASGGSAETSSAAPTNGEDSRDEL